MGEMIKNFEEIEVWKLAQEIFIELYREFKHSKEFYIRDQILKATLSISNNIAEGFERQSKAEFRRFLKYALASAAEVRSILYLIDKIENINLKSVQELIEKTRSISRMINALIHTLK